ncbi:MAG: hypothetical protein PWQ10_201 [Patescibacteria group bacterium]|nr:hypothetical protein [Patescibacteria group bacterium]
MEILEEIMRKEKGFNDKDIIKAKKIYIHNRGCKKNLSYYNDFKLVVASIEEVEAIKNNKKNRYNRFLLLFTICIGALVFI